VKETSAFDAATAAHVDELKAQHERAETVTALERRRRATVRAVLTDEPQTLRALGAATGIDHTTLDLVLTRLALDGEAKRIAVGKGGIAKQNKWGWMRA
jgi:hypothetical protein